MIEAAGHPLTTNHLYFGWYYGRFRDLERVVGLPGLLAAAYRVWGAGAARSRESLEEIWPRDAPRLAAFSPKTTGCRSREWSATFPGGEIGAFLTREPGYQAEVLKHATELFRRRKYRPTGGTFAFMLNDPAPAISWSVIDWRRRPKSAYGVLSAR